MIKVALFIHLFPSPEHPYILDWTKKLAHAGIDLTIYVEQMGDWSLLPKDVDFQARVRYLNSLESPVRSLKINFVACIKNILKIPGSIRILRKSHPGKPLSVLRKLYEYMPFLGKRFDIVHFNAPQLAVRRFELGRLLSAKTLVSFRGQDFSFDALRFQSLLKQADHLHFISNHLIELAKEQGYIGRKHTLIPPLVDLDFYRPSIRTEIKTKSDPWVFFTAARFSWTKGWEFALQAIALLVQKGWNIQYFIAGQGDFRDAIMYTLHELNLQCRVHFLDWITPEEVATQMQKSDLYLLASIEEGFNNSVLQAQSCGLPVVCSDAGGLPENIEDGKTGLLFHRRDAWDMADKIESIIGNYETRLQMRYQARKRIELLFDARTHVQNFIVLYENVTGQ